MVEITTMMGRSAVAWTKRGYVLPLLNSGQLLMTLPEKPNAINQKYVTAEANVLIVSTESVLAYCQKPRRKGEIYAHFGTSAWQMRSILDPLIEDGRLIGSDPENPKNHWQRFVSADSGYSVEKDENIIKYCQIPRSRQEIAKQFGIHIKYVVPYIKPLLQNGKLKMTKPETPSSIDQRYINNMADAAILSADEVMAFCDRPRDRKEIAEKFGLKYHNAKEYICRLVLEGKLKMTIPMCPASWHQKYVRPDIKVRQLTEESLLKYCREPRSKREITEYYKIHSSMTMGKYLEGFINYGKLIRTIPKQPKNKMQRYIAKNV